MGEDGRDLVDATVVARRTVARDICEFTFRGAPGQRLPSWEPGSHVDVLTPSGLRRSYSLTDRWPPRDDHYVIAVAREADGRGGSRSMHDHVREGDAVRITPARNSFPVAPAPEYVLIAGGVGITPIRSMFHRLRAEGNARITLIYLVRSLADAAYHEELAGAVGADVVIHGTDESQGRRFDLWPVLRDPRQRRVYTCASPGLVESVRRMTAHWRSSRVHFEQFTPAEWPDAFAQPFDATWAPTSTRFRVPPDTSLLDVLRSAGIPVPASCRSGTCGVCRLSVLSGRVDHHDLILSDDERLTHMTSCVSRGSTEIEVGPPRDTDGLPTSEVVGEPS